MEDLKLSTEYELQLKDTQENLNFIAQHLYSEKTDATKFGGGEI